MLEREAILVLIFFIITIFILILFIVVFSILFHRRKNKLLLQQIEAEKTYEQELAKSQIEIQENILKNIGWELHDNVGQLLSVANLQLSMLSNQLSPEHAKEITQTKEIIKQTVQEIRSLSKVLNNDVILKNGLISTLKTEIERINRLQYLKAAIFIEGTERKVGNSEEIIIFRIIQECLSNILKHAKASELSLYLYFEKKFLNIVLTDDGIGFNISKRYDGSGMETIRNRALLIHADLEVLSKIGKGTTISLKYYYKHAKSK